MYDLIVIGDDLSSHVAAVYACQNGLNTLLIAENGLGGLQLIGDFVFNLDPTPLTGMGPDQYGSSILAQLGIVIPEDHSTPVNPAFQIILPNHRVDFFSNLEALLSELRREFPDAITDIEEFYHMASDTSSVFQDWLNENPKLQPQSVKEFFSYLKIFPYIFRYKFGSARFDKILSLDSSLEKIWEAQQALLSLNNNDLFCFSSAFQYCAPFRGVYYFPQGKQFLYNALIEKLDEQKGSYLSNHDIQSISGKKIIELEVKAPDGSISKVSGLDLIISTKSDKLSMLQGSHKHINMSDWFRPAKIVYYPFTVYFGVASKCLPQQLARHIAVVTDVTKDLYDNNLIILETSLPEKDKNIFQSKTSLSATVYMPDVEEYWTLDALKKEAEAILERLEQFLPFLKENIELAAVDKSIDIARESRKVFNPKYSVRNALLTSFSAKSHKTRLKNVYLTGASLLADAGFDAEMISGRNAAMHVIEKRR